MGSKTLFADLDAILEGKIFDEPTATETPSPVATPTADRSPASPVTTSPKRSERGTFLPTPTKKGTPTGVEKPPTGVDAGDESDPSGSGNPV